MSKKTGIVGTGNMGGGMAKRLLGLGWPVFVHDLDTTKQSALQAAGAQACAHAAALAQELCRQVGYERMLWASDCPFVGVESTTYQSTIDWLNQAVPDPRNRRVLDLNAIDLYFSGAR